jgi:hypothetical protein
MTHPAEEQLIEHVLASPDEPASGELQAHLEACERCRNDVEELRRVLRATAADDVPTRGPEYGAQVWARLEPRLPRTQRSRWVAARPWLAAAAAVLLAVTAFVAGRWSRPATPASPRANAEHAAPADARSIRERVVLAVLTDHVERAERALVELANTHGSGTIDIAAEQAWARDLLDANRLYRQAARAAAPPALSEVLDEIEPILLDIVHSPSRLTAGELRALQARIEERSLVFKLRFSGAEMRARQRTVVHSGEPTT